jgi:hypothetical protein
MLIAASVTFYALLALGILDEIVDAELETRERAGAD